MRPNISKLMLNQIRDGVCIAMREDDGLKSDVCSFLLYCMLVFSYRRSLLS